ATPTDTVALIFSTLSPDTTAPRIARARAVDSLHVRIEFDDPVDPELALEGVRAQVLALPDSTPFAAVVRVMTQEAFESERRAAADSIAADSAAADTAAVVNPVMPADDDPTADAARLPVRELVLRL